MTDPRYQTMITSLRRAVKRVTFWNAMTTSILFTVLVMACIALLSGIVQLALGFMFLVMSFGFLAIMVKRALEGNARL